MHLEGSDQEVGEGEIRRSSINIMEICYSSARLPVWKCRRRHEFLQAENVCLHAEMENLPAEIRSVSGWRKRVERQKEKACYNICTMDTFHVSLVTSKPRLLQIMSYVTRNHISVLLIPPCRTRLRPRSTETRLR